MRRFAAGVVLAATVTVVGGLTSATPAAAGTGAARHEAADSAAARHEAAGTVPAAGAPEVVATGLNNPRQLAVLGSGRSLLIAEAGRGGSRCTQVFGCVGATGSIALVRNAWAAHYVRPQRIVTGLLSAAAPDGGFAIGSDGVAAQSLDRIYIQVTNGPPDLLPAPLPGQVGKLLLARRGQLQPVADISAVEIASDPDGQGVDSNPYAVLALPGRQLVADAAGNDILEVRNGHVRVFAVLPNHDGHQSVPTSLAAGPRGTIYVGELNGENPGTARVWQLSSSGRVLGWVGGFTTITGVAVGRDGSYFVSELFADAGAGPPGQVTQVLRNGRRLHYRVPFPAGLAIGRPHQVYVSAWSISDADGTDLGHGAAAAPGQVWRLTT
jgi:hypothetical protein